MANAELKEKNMYVGTVTSDLMDKTIVVRVERTYMHPQFHKTMRVAKKYKVHDAQEQANIGDTVEFYEGRPMSKTKYMYLARVVSVAESSGK
jgi:small subunit ribosomal protein S17